MTAATERLKSVRLLSAVAAIVLSGLGAAIAQDTGETKLAAPAAANDTVCSQALAAMDGAGSAGHLADGAAAFDRMAKSEPPCQPRMIFCAGRRLALAHLEAAYAAGEKGQTTTAERLLREGRRFGQPWQLLAGLGDAATIRAHARHNRTDWADASKAFQEALIAFNDAGLCEGEMPPPAPAALKPLLEKTERAMLLAGDATFARTKCGGLCELPFLAPIAGFTPETQILPITFEPKSAALTPSGAKIVVALSSCMRERQAAQLTLAARSSDAPAAKTLANARLQTIRHLFADSGARAELTTIAEDDVMLGTDHLGSLSRLEADTLNERIELRSVQPVKTSDCR